MKIIKLFSFCMYKCVVVVVVVIFAAVVTQRIFYVRICYAACIISVLNEFTVSERASARVCMYVYKSMLGCVFVFLFPLFSIKRLKTLCL